MLSHKEIADRLRGMSCRIGSLTQASITDLANELDPPRPEPLEVLVKVPPVSEWPDYMTGIEWKPIVNYARSTWNGTVTTIITRAEAERMESER